MKKSGKEKIQASNANSNANSNASNASNDTKAGMNDEFCCKLKSCNCKPKSNNIGTMLTKALVGLGVLDETNKKNRKNKK